MGIFAYDIVSISYDGAIYKFIFIRVLLYESEAIMRV